MNDRFRCTGLLVDWRSRLLFLPLMPYRTPGRGSRGWLFALNLLCLVSSRASKIRRLMEAYSASDRTIVRAILRRRA